MTTQSTVKEVKINLNLQQFAVKPAGELELQISPVQFNVFDPNSGRNFTTDINGRRVTKQREMTASQIVAVQSLRSQAKRPVLSNHSMKQMSVDSASVIYEDMKYIIEREQFAKDTFDAMQEEINSLNEVIEALKKINPKEVEKALLRQKHFVDRELSR